MKLGSGFETRKARVEMLPLIDVVFLLLVFFIYAMLSMVVHRGLKVDLPAAGTATLEQQESIAITLDAENRIFLEREPVAIEAVAGLVASLRGASARPVSIDGDRQAGLGVAIELLDRLKKAGIEEVSFSCRSGQP